MLNIRNFTSNVRSFGLFLATLTMVVAILSMPALAAGPSVKGDRTPSIKGRVATPINLAILIQDDLVSHVSNELGVTREFIQSLPEGSQVMVGYITSGSLQVRQPFTADLKKAARSLRIIVASSAGSPFNPYVETLEALRKFDAQSKNRNVVLLISDGLDTSRGFDATVLHSVDMERAIAEAKRRNVSIYSFYVPSVGLTRRNFLAASYGLGSLDRVAHETGGQTFSNGTTDFVTFNPFFERLTRALNQREYAE